MVRKKELIFLCSSIRNVRNKNEAILTGKEFSHAVDVD